MANEVFLELTWLKKTKHGAGAVTVEHKKMLHAFNSAARANKYWGDAMQEPNCVSGEIISPQEAVERFGEYEDKKARKINKDIQDLEKALNKQKGRKKK